MTIKFQFFFKARICWYTSNIKWGNEFLDTIHKHFPWNQTILWIILLNVPAHSVWVRFLIKINYFHWFFHFFRFETTCNWKKKLFLFIFFFQSKVEKNMIVSKVFEHFYFDFVFGIDWKKKIRFKFIPFKENHAFHVDELRQKQLNHLIRLI